MLLILSLFSMFPMFSRLMAVAPQAPLPHSMPLARTFKSLPVITTVAFPKLATC
jgi:hypothetical protein